MLKSCLLKYYMCSDHVYYSTTYVLIMFIKVLVLHVPGFCLLNYICLDVYKYLERISSTCSTSGIRCVTIKLHGHHI